MKTQIFPTHADPYRRCSRLVPETPLDRALLHAVIRRTLPGGIGYVDHHYLDQSRDDEPGIKIHVRVDSPEYWTEDGCLIGSIQCECLTAADGFMELFDAPFKRIYFWVEQKAYSDRTELEVVWSLGDGHESQSNRLPHLPVLHSREGEDR